MSKKATLFNTVVRRLLDQRYALLRSGQTPEKTDLRNFFYICRNTFLKENPTLKEIDTTAIKEQVYANFENHAIKGWCQKHCPEMNVPAELYWRLREMLGIRAEGKAVCEGESGKFLIDHTNRERVAQGCSFILVCEKKTVSEKLLSRLRSLGYKVNLVGAGGQNVSDLQEAIMKATEGLDVDSPTFYILVLHDYDLAGVRFFFTLKARYAGVIDIGVNPQLIQHWKDIGGYDARLVEEQVQNKNHQNNLLELMSNEESDYTADDFTYLQGVQQPDGKTWMGKRIEIDALEVAATIEPFISYIQQKIADECTVWDLTRIGLSDFSLEEPSNPFQDALDYFHQDISEKCNDAVTRLYKPLNRVREFVKNVTSLFLNEYAQVCANEGIVSTNSTYEDGTWIYHVNREDVNKLKEKYQAGFDKEYTPDYEDDLDEINGQIENYEGDVTTAVDDLSDQHISLQEQVNEAATNDPDAKAFDDALGEIYWGEEELEKVAVPDEIQVTREVIRRLQEHLAILEKNNGSGVGGA